MTYDIMPGTLWKLWSSRWPSVWDDEEDILSSQSSSGLSVSEDDKQVTVEAAVPGVDPKDVDVTFDKGLLWIKAEAQHEEEGKKYYRKAASSFSYRVAVPGEIDYNAEPQASVKNGVMKVTFSKSPKSQPKKLTVKSE